MGTKKNPGKFDCLAKIGDDEPFFVLRAQDMSAPGLIDAWVTKNKNSVSPDKLKEARDLAENMRLWKGRRAPT